MQFYFYAAKSTLPVLHTTAWSYTRIQREKPDAVLSPTPRVQTQRHGSRGESVRCTSDRNKRQADQRGEGWVVADKEAYTVRTINIISQWLHFEARCHSFYVANVFGLRSIHTYTHKHTHTPTCAVISFLKHQSKSEFSILSTIYTYTHTHILYILYIQPRILYCCRFL
jgi:hypothetical protein